ncbi:type II secretion system F family protein [Bradyrhizobium sp. Arg237L]|uniref:type II secretion system F family protein n=1 Tax=Bradyrhizobium sp. Arg237L TaxID=3003352 RepID=UPI00249DDB0B|nr:type II secretion system F family protein [Bradyrhizobium sp. Arg237L]MDI4235733.1 type II secretion system F family protein [Bradyrhizobium sp. Arg237L]
MPHYRYRALTKAGEIILGDVDAPSREEVLRRIEYLGHLPVEAEIAGGGARRSGISSSGLPRPRELTTFMRLLALLLRSGLTLEAALQTLEDDTNKAVARFAGGLRSAVSGGDGFAEALERHDSIIEPIYIAMVRAGEASGKLEVVLRAIVEDRTRREQLSQRISAAIRYPMFLVGSAVLILFFFLLYVVPQFESVFTELRGKLNAGAAFALTMSTWLRANLDTFLGVCAAMLLVGWLILRQQGARAWLVGALASIPGVAGVMNDRRTARFVGTLGLLVENGVALPAALKILRDIITEPRYAAAVDQVHEQVRNGRRFIEALAESDLVPPLAVRMLRVGDETGDLSAIAQHAAQFYEQRLAIGLDRLMGAIGPITIIAVSIGVGTLIVSIMSALLSITELAM